MTDPRDAEVARSSATEQHEISDRARGGSTPHVARIVLGVSLVLIVVAFAIILFVNG